MRENNGTEIKFTTKADRIDEFPGQEIGLECELPADVDPDLLALTIYQFFRKNSDDKFTIAASLPKILEVKTRHLRYSLKDHASEKNKLYVVNIRDRDGVISVKRKGEKTERKRVIFRQEHEKIIPNAEWSPETEVLIKLEQSSIFSVQPNEITQTEDTKKRKLKVRIQNRNSSRLYTVGIITKTRKNGQSENSLSIDYIGRESESLHANTDTMGIVIDDINELEGIILPLLVKKEEAEK